VQTGVIHRKTEFLHIISHCEFLAYTITCIIPIGFLHRPSKRQKIRVTNRKKSFNMMIRRARKEDSKAITNILLLAMDTIIYKFIGEDSMDKASCFLEGLVRKEANQYSYENCWVAVSDEEIIGVVNVYEGADFLRLRTPVLDEINIWSQKGFTPEVETENGELYIDSLGVSPKLQGKGIGSKLLKFLITEYVLKDKKTLGLLVDLDNTGASRLYYRLGFVKVGEKLLLGKKMEHLQLKY